MRLLKTVSIGEDRTSGELIEYIIVLQPQAHHQYFPGIHQPSSGSTRGLQEIPMGLRGSARSGRRSVKARA